MEWFEFMNGADGRKRELANFEIDVKPRKKGGASTAKKKPASANAKPGASASKKTAAAPKKAASAAKKASATAAKSPAAKKPTGGTKAAASSSKKNMNTQKKTTAKRPVIEENPLAAMESKIISDPKPGTPYDVPVDIVPRRRAAQPPAADPYDAYDEPLRRNSSPKKKKKKRRKKSPFSAMTALLLLLIAGCVGVGAWRMNEYENFIAMKAVVSQQTFYQGTAVNGIDVSGMTLPQALEYWDTQVEPKYRETAAVLNDGTRITAAQMGYSSDYVNTLSAAWNAGRSGSLVERYKRASMHMQQPKSYEVTRSMYDQDTVKRFVNQLAEQVDAEAVDAKLQSFDVNTQQFSYTREQQGRTLNRMQLAQDIVSALEDGGGNVQLEIETVQPQLTMENVSSQYGMITSAVTNASSSSSNRLNNIALALQMINGISLEPGESFSFNKVVGERTRDRGFKSAPAYSGGEVTEEVGGGICQVSTTLFNAAVKSDMQIDERHSHSLTVSYVDLGKDAAVDWGNKDLRFTNTSDDRVYICCYLSEDKRVHIGVFGKLIEDGVTITLEGKKTGTVEPETEYQLNFTMPSGKTKVIQKGKEGYSAAAYKIWWDRNGNDIKREMLCKSNYKATKEIVEYGP